LRGTRSNDIQVAASTSRNQILVSNTRRKVFFQKEKPGLLEDMDSSRAGLRNMQNDPEVAFNTRNKKVLKKKN
jgi:hypothetical protein